MNAIHTARILLVDDHEVLREGLKFLISNARPGWEIVGEATNGLEAIEKTQQLKPDIILLDISMPEMSGLEAATRLRKLGVNCPILIFTTHESAQLSDDARQVGAQGVVLKGQAFRDLVRAIERLLLGGTFFDAPNNDETPEEKRKPGPIYYIGLSPVGATA